MDVEPRCDHRGFVAQSFSANEFASCGLNSEMAQTSISYNHARGTLRGLHRQMPPHAEAKLVRCTSGAIANVAVDVRPESRTYGKHVLVRLTAKNHRSLFVPPYVAHGFQTLVDHTEVIYQVSGDYELSSEQGFRWDEPQFGIEWPLPVTVVSEKDACWPFLASAESTAL